MSDSRSLIQDVLRPGERIVWTGRPQAWRLALPLIIPLAFIAVWAGIPFSIFLMGLSGNLQTDAGEQPDALLVVLFPGIFVLVGGLVLLAILRSLIGAWRTHYGLTDQRVVIVNNVWPRSVQSFGASAVSEMTRTGGDDAGTIRFGSLYAAWGQRGGSWGGRAALVGIPEPRRVEALIHENLLKHNKHTESAHR